MAGYDFAGIEKKWQQYWEQNQTFRVPNPGEADFQDLPKYYVLDMFPYPSGAGLHVGHPEGYTATDIVARYRRMRGYNVLHPMGYDAFGLPAEQYAVEHGVHPRVTTERNIANIERQIKMFGFSYDWSRRVATTDVAYYRWTQWIFLQLFNSWYDPSANAARPIRELFDKLTSGQYWVDMDGNIVPEPPAGHVEAVAGAPVGLMKFQDMDADQQRRLIDEYRLAYMAEVAVNWCPRLGTVLANEEVTNDGRSDRGNFPVFRRPMRQWMLRITAYTERLLADLDLLDWPEPIKAMQRNWIGKSTGAEVDFPLQVIEGGTAFQAVPNAEFRRVSGLDESQMPTFFAKSFEPCDPFPEGQPDPPERSRTCRNLPHLVMPGATYFVTFRAKGKTLSDKEKNLVANAVLYWHGKRCVLFAAVIMDDHVHLIIRPTGEHLLRDILASIKSFSAHQVNLMRESGDHLWQDESFDHIIRHGKSFNEFLHYIVQNPVKRKLAARPDQYQWLYVNKDEIQTEDGSSYGHSLEGCATQDRALSEVFQERAHSGFPVYPDKDVIRVYTTRPDTLFGATYMVLAPEHPMVEEITTESQKATVKAYVESAAHKSELERAAEGKEKTGVFTGAYAMNPVTAKPIPIWAADYVMMGYGTGAIMAVPAHDTRDLEFAEKFNLPVIQVVQPPEGQDWRGFIDDGIAINSGPYDGMTTEEFKKRIAADLHRSGLGREAVKYKLRDWLFSRQRYWGEPFPILHCPTCGTVPLRDEQLPLELPEMDDFSPATSEDPEALPEPPLARATAWVSAPCPLCGQTARRETNTMPQWAGSCWYYLRYLDAGNNERFVSAEAEKYWMGRDEAAKTGGVDLYVGGAEHAVLHLLYARFWHKVLFDLGHVSFPEPFYKLFNQGMIRSFAYKDQRGMYIGYDEVDLTGPKPRHKTTGEELIENVEKMSKSLKNVVNPDEVIGQYGADTFRLYEMFMGPLEASKPWNTRDVPGVHRFCQRVYRMICGGEDQAALVKREGDTPDIEKLLHKLTKKVGEDIEAMKFNTAIAAMMEFVNAVYKAGAILTEQAERFLLLLAPFTPHLAEELWQVLGHDATLAYEPWPDYDEAMLEESVIELPVQISGKLRSRISVPADADNDAVLAAALADPKVAAAVEGKQIVKSIVVPGKMVNLVVK